MRGAIKKSGALKFNMITNKPSPSSVQPQIKHKFLNNIQEEPGVKNSKLKAKVESKSTGKITFLVRDDAWIQEKDIGKHDSINQPIPGLIVQTQFQREKAQLSGREHKKQTNTVKLIT